MDQEQRNQEFKQLADTFIDLANQHCDKVENTRVGSSMLFASARFSAFVVASHAKDQAHYESEIDNAIEFFSQEFKRMLTENLEEYKAIFAARDLEKPKYEHLVKKQEKNNQ